jgi:Flp pilus assembly protein TadD
MAAIFFFAIIMISHAWILIIPLASLILAYFFKPDKKKAIPFYTLFSILFIPLIVIFFIYQFGSAVKTRLADRTTTNERALTNQQKLTPVIEGYPYTVAEMTKLYIFPHTLTIYYDGKTISDWEYRSMFVIFFAYGFLIYFFYKKDKRICGLLLMLLVLLAPVFSPYKVTWFMTERYLYFGTGIFTTLLVLLFMYVEKKSSFKNLSVILTALVLVAYGIRSFSRNTEWKNPETLALATIQTAGASVRPYNDLAGYYVLQGRYDDAKRYYAQALTIQGSLTAMRNLGYIYLKRGIDDTILTQTSARELYDRAEAALNNQDAPYALFLYKESFNKDPQNSEVKKRIISLYIEGGQLEKAEDLIQTGLIASPNDADLYYLLGYLSFQKGQKNEAIEYLNKTLSIDPRHSQAQTNLQMLMSSP